MDEIIAIARSIIFGLSKIVRKHTSPLSRSIVGTFGDAATFSFYPGKNLGAYGDAGCIVTDDDRLADWTATFARHGGKGEHVMEGINSRMDGMQAADIKRQASLPAGMDDRAPAGGSTLQRAY